MSNKSFDRPEDRAVAGTNAERLVQILEALRKVDHFIIHTHEKHALLENICNCLTAKQVYSNAWIITFTEDYTLLDSSEAGMRDLFPVIRDKFVGGELMACCQQAVAGEEVVVMQDRRLCRSCPLAKIYCGNGGVPLITGLRHEGKIVGVLGASISVDFAATEEEKSVFSSIAESIANAFSSFDVEESRIEAEQAFRESEIRWSFAVEGMKYGVWDWNAQTDRIFFSHEWKAMLGYTDEEIGDSFAEWASRVHPDDIGNCYKDLERYFNGETDSYINEHRMCHKDGHWVWILDRGKILEKTPDGKPLRIIGTHADISEKKQIEKDLDFKSNILDQIADIITATDLEGIVTYVNDATCKMLGKTREEIVGKSIHTYGEDSFRGATQEDIILKTRTEGKWRGEIVNYGANGKVYILDCRTQQVLDKNGNLLGLCGISTDITEKKQAEAALKESEEQFRSLFQQMNLGVAIYEAVDDGEDFIFVDMNDAGQKYCQMSLAELVGKRITETFPQVRDIGLFACIQNVYTTGQPELLPFKEYEDNRIKLWVENRIFRLPSKQIVAMFEDRSEQHQLEERMHHLEKLDAIGHLAGGIAHDFNNQLSGIIGYAEMLEKKLKDQDACHYASNIIKASTRAAEMTAKLLAFGRKGKNLSIPIDVNSMISDVANMLERSIDKRIHILLKLAASKAVISGDPTQVNSAILNLGINARDAMPEGGKLCFETSFINLDREFIRRHGYKMELGAYIRIAVTDTGTGMTEAIRTRAFEPFFTTKSEGKGSGLGLASVYGTVKNHGGAIEIYSEPGHGTTFNIYFPLSATDEVHIPKSTMFHSQRHERILVVDDEEMLRSLASDMLQELGYTVQTCVNGRDAVTYYETAWQEIDLVLMDMVMPEMGGHDAFLAMQQINPDIRVVLVSGYSINGEAQAILDKGVKAFLGKPYKQSELSEKIAQALYGTDVTPLKNSEAKPVESERPQSQPFEPERLPAELVQELENIVLTLDVTELKAVAKRIQRDYPEVSSLLEKAAEEFDFDCLSEILDRG